MLSYLGLGSNLGDRLTTLQTSLDYLNQSETIRLLRVSPVYETSPVGGPQQPDFFNAAAEIETESEPHELLHICREIENKLGRTRSIHWGPRTLDIDILLYGEEQIQTDRLTIPHPHMHERAFVLKPLADIASQAVHPVSGKSIGELLGTIDCSGVRKLDKYLLKVYHTNQRLT
ncbi:2-amino-4-hydroxy-6-hydroxymethyldihydropteridine diphosphokinase [Candidatus Omnitrophota bacterium]